MDVQALKQGFVPFKQLFQRADQQAFAEAARAGEKVEPSLPDHLSNQSGLVDIVAALVSEVGK